MTISAWIVLVIIGVCGFALAAFLLWDAMEAGRTPQFAIGICILVLTIALCGLLFWWRSNSESGKRALKDQQSNLSGGIERTVRVYDINGNLIQEYSGKFDIETDKKSYILFDDAEGHRHIIYYTTGTIIVDEK